ncbi:MAG: LptA/OstA family protein [Trueperaceae bacterium]|nr:LptA/OstA family protein [Trueperaceae bacterium]
MPAYSFAQDADVDNRPQLRINRNDRVIRVVQNAPSAEGGEFRLNARCEEGIRYGTVYAPAPYEVETFVNDARITSQIVIEKRPGGSEDESRLELFGGTLTIDDATLCPTDIAESETADVTIFEGRTTTTGSRFNYNNAQGLGTLIGPITLERTAEGESPALSATSQSLDIDVDQDVTVLQGGVQLTSGDRVSAAETVEFDEQAGMAVLRGDPAESRDGDNVVRGQIIEYDLDSNDVVVREGISASFELDD